MVNGPQTAGFLVTWSNRPPHIAFHLLSQVSHQFTWNTSPGFNKGLKTFCKSLFSLSLCLCLIYFQISLMLSGCGTQVASPNWKHMHFAGVPLSLNSTKLTCHNMNSLLSKLLLFLNWGLYVIKIFIFPVCVTRPLFPIGIIQSAFWQWRVAWGWSQSFPFLSSQVPCWTQAWQKLDTSVGDSHGLCIWLLSSACYFF